MRHFFTCAWQVDAAVALKLGIACVYVCVRVCLGRSFKKGLQVHCGKLRKPVQMSFGPWVRGHRSGYAVQREKWVLCYGRAIGLCGFLVYKKRQVPI